MLKIGDIKPVTPATPWISSLVITKSNKDTSIKTVMKDLCPKSKIRVCLDPTNLNKATKWVPYYYQTIEDVTPELKAAKYFTTADMKCGFLQVTLDAESSLLTTF